MSDLLQTIRRAQVENHENPSVCGTCPSPCCGFLPGEVFPQELDPELRPEILRRKAQSLIATGRYAVDWWEGDPRRNISESERVSCGYYLRPAIEGHEGNKFHAAWSFHGGCTFLGPEGCTLAHDARPLGCRAVVPAIDAFSGKRDCRSTIVTQGGFTNSKHAAAIAWLPFHEALL
jgi:Fe-S-cluster containining protein